jgi:hypothetical protein
VDEFEQNCVTEKLLYSFRMENFYTTRAAGMFSNGYCKLIGYFVTSVTMKEDFINLLQLLHHCAANS